MVRFHPVGAEAELSFRRCNARRRAVLMLSSLTEAYPRQLAQAIGVDPTRLRAIMEGRPPEYSVKRSPLALGLATLVATSHGRKYMITAKGRKKARMMTARIERRGARAPQVHIQASDASRAPVGAPVGPSFSWRVGSGDP